MAWIAVLQGAKELKRRLAGNPAFGRHSMPYARLERGGPLRRKLHVQFQAALPVAHRANSDDSRLAAFGTGAAPQRDDPPAFAIGDAA